MLKGRKFNMGPILKEEWITKNDLLDLFLGFESDTNDRRKDFATTSLIGSQTHPYGSMHHHGSGSSGHPHSLAMMTTYWADDHSLWNPNLIAPDPYMENTARSFSITYLEDASVAAAAAARDHGDYEVHDSDDSSPKAILGSSIIPKMHASSSAAGAVAAAGNGHHGCSLEPAISVDDDVFF